MFWWKRQKCQHVWHHLRDSYITVNTGASVDFEDACWIFCSKCQKEKLVYKEEWERIHRKQKILNVNPDSIPLSHKGGKKMIETKHHTVFEPNNLILKGFYEFISKYAPIIGDSRMYEDLLAVYYSLEQDLEEENN